MKNICHENKKFKKDFVSPSMDLSRRWPTLLKVRKICLSTSRSGSIWESQLRKLLVENYLLNRVYRADSFVTSKCLFCECFHVVAGLRPFRSWQCSLPSLRFGMDFGCGKWQVAMGDGAMDAVDGRWGIHERNRPVLVADGMRAPWYAVTQKATRGNRQRSLSAMKRMLARQGSLRLFLEVTLWKREFEIRKVHPRSPQSRAVDSVAFGALLLWPLLTFLPLYLSQGGKNPVNECSIGQQTGGKDACCLLNGTPRFRWLPPRVRGGISSSTKVGRMAQFAPRNTDFTENS